MSSASSLIIKLRENPLFQQVLKSGVGTAFRLTSVSLNLLFSIIGARLIGAEQFGDYVTLMAIAGLISVALSFGLPTLISREVAAARGDPKSGYLHELHDWAWLLILALIGMTALGWVFLDRTVALVLLFVTISNAVALGAAILTGHERVLIAAAIGDCLRPFTCLLVLGAFVAIGFSTAQRPWGIPDPTLPTAAVENVVFAQIAGVSVALIAVLLVIGYDNIIHAMNRHRAIPKFSIQHLYYVRAGILLAGTQLLINSTTQIDILILRWLAEPVDAAHYFAAARGALIVSFFFGINALFAEPKLTRLLAQGARDEAQLLACQTMKSGVVLTVFASLTALVFGRLYLNLFGDGFDRAYISMAVLLLGLVLWSLSGPAQSALRASRRDAFLLGATGISVVVNLVVSICLVPFIGMIGAAIGSAAQFAIYGTLLAIACRRYAGIRTDVFATIHLQKA